MLRKICLQAGHENAKNNCDPILAKGTGAPGEQEFTVRTRNRLSEILLSKKNQDGTPAFTLQLVDACFNCNPTANDQDYAMFMAIHYDADVYGATGTREGGFLDFPEPSTDFATQESQRLVRVISEEYFPNAGIKKMENRRNANTKFYYMWKFLSAKTPCVIIECGVGQDPHDKVILADTDRVCNAIARGICKAFGVPFDVPTPPTPVPPTPTPPNWEQKYNDEVNSHNTTKAQFLKFQQDSAIDKTNAVKAETERCRTKVINVANSL